MTAQEFNKKYKDYLETGFEDQGLEFDIPEVTKFLDEVFEDVIRIQNFNFAQIKLKFGMARFYSNVHQIGSLIEAEIDRIIKRNDLNEKIKKVS